MSQITGVVVCGAQNLGLGLKSAGNDINVLGSMLRIAENVITVVKAIFEEYQIADYFPAQLVNLKSALAGALSGLSARKWMADTGALLSSDAIEKGYLYMASKALAVSSDALTTAKWLAQANVISQLPRSLGTVTAFGRDLVLKDLSALASHSLELADNAKKLLDAGWERATSAQIRAVVMSSCKVGAFFTKRAAGPIGVVATALLHITTSSIALYNWSAKVEWIAVPSAPAGEGAGGGETV